jgi:hypothetical protein
VTWQQLLKEGRVEVAQPSKPELDDWRSIVARCLHDANLPLFPDNRFSLTYNAARTLAVMAVAAAGYRVKSFGGGHVNTFRALKAALGSDIHALADYLDACREKRNELSYESANVITETEAAELISRTVELRSRVETWIAQNHPHLAG